MTERDLTLADLEEVCALCREAKQTLAARGVQQWQSGFPDRESLSEDLNSGTCFALTDRGRIAAFTRLNLEDEAEYEHLESGEWLTHGTRYATIHRTVVSPPYRSTGLSDQLFEAALCRAKAAGCASVRVDTHRDNRAMRNLITRQGFVLCCTFLLPYPDASPERLGYEKLL